MDMNNVIRTSVGLLQNWLLSLSYWEGWANVALCRLVPDVGQWVPQASPFSYSKILSKFKRSQEELPKFATTFSIDSEIQ